MPTGFKSRAEREAWLEFALRALGLTPGNLPWMWLKTDSMGISRLVCRSTGRVLGHGPTKFADSKWRGD